MSIRLEMLQVARVAPKLLGESAALVEAFLRRQQNPDGGFKDRTGRSDLYYTVFALDGLLALQAALPLDSAIKYLQTFGDGDGLDFVHRCCLARAWATVTHQGGAGRVPEELRTKLLGGVEKFRSADGGYSVAPGAAHGTAYGCFLGLAAYQDLHAEPPEPLRLIQCLKFLETPDGAWANERTVPIGSTNAAAAAVTVLRQFAAPLNPAVAGWLRARIHAEGGFLAAPAAPMPDLLSSATALHALAGMQADLAPLREPCLDFVDSLWTNEGGFYGHWADEHLDVEYTYYGLLALGHLG